MKRNPTKTHPERFGGPLPEINSLNFLQLGQSTVLSALCMNHALADKTTPPKARYIIKAALAYIYPPTSNAADVSPLKLGDIVGVVASAASVVEKHIKPRHIQQAKKSLAELFPLRHSIPQKVKSKRAAAARSKPSMSPPVS